jgi:hypothetical protein
MPDWSRFLPDPIVLKDNTILFTLQDAADFMLQLPAVNKRNALWQEAAKLCMKAAGTALPYDIAMAAWKLVVALKAEGVL